ncbi:hypothetical protein INT47_006282 [Mucor saturninus]|uniref:Uncharacterized protein n=1 Tax=Mucor saturninus TaxID=64648 RepID=A0A8H7VC80_9FUNG|nr:hypothetical protein INT47_006282 [Mucor saturninus]
MSNNNSRDEQPHYHPQQQQYQQQQRPRISNPYSDNPTFNTFYPNNGSHTLASNPYNTASTTGEPIINNYYQLQQQQQQLYQPQQPQYTFQTFVPAQPPSLQQFSDPVVPTEPDEFIIDLLRKPQQRLFLLKLELEIEAFIKDEQKLRLDLPGMNSYQRLIVHKLAPYYKLNHYHDAMRKAVYVCKTFITELPKVRLPDVRLDEHDETESLSSATATTTAATASSQNGDPHATEESSHKNEETPPQFKIMRRSEGSSPSSRNSNTEDASKESRKNMTFEERKTAYEEARARIFQNLETANNKQ